MKRRLMKKWIAALRSGKYKQGKEKLLSYDNDSNPCYCCLGVLQAIEPRIITDDVDELLDPESVKKFLGVSTTDGFNQSKYAQWNDRGDPFSVIASRLEQQWLTEKDK